MRRVLLAGAALIAFWPAGAARAADTAQNWSGIYIGVHAGAGWGAKRWFEDGSLGVPGILRSSYDISGWLAGGQVGFNLQTGRAVFGVELDAGASGISGRQGVCYVGFGLQSCDSRINSIITIAGRIGWTFDRLLAYAKVGYGWLDERHNNPFPGLGVWTASEMRNGLVAGAGFEYALSNPWSLKLEYNHFGLGTRNLQFTGPIPGNVFGADIRQSLGLVKIGLNYRFNPIR